MKNNYHIRVKDVMPGKTVQTIHPDHSVQEAITLMLTHDYSQLPVMVNREVKGIISWKSITMKRLFTHDADKVKDCIDNKFEEIKDNEKLIDAVPKVLKYDFVLVRGGRNEIVGIITLADITKLYLNLAEPFLLIGEIEKHLRALINKNFKNLSEIIKRPEYRHPVDSAEDLSFGSYIEILGKEERWEKLKLPIDRAEFINQMKDINIIRNKIMHYRMNAFDSNDIDSLLRFSKVLRTIFKLADIE